MNLAEQIAARQKELNLTDLQLAAKAKITLNTLRRVKKNEDANPTLYVLQNLQNALDTKFNI